MTWIPRIVNADNSNTDYGHDICHKTGNPEMGQSGCKHISFCNIKGVSQAVANVLTNVRTGTDGHMACGEMVLKCQGYEANEPVEGSGDDTGA